ncbi:hypothetical protein TTHERM_00013710 (macronuclear) [Tetrahymena thermophila SB210]|uniref:Transmembrane protein n=1 Tax=Tetrahymena thermophila (strain SB210) TaxID=312017 RepID=Q22RL7_TETTS|nr:hypothetical protein TTHERM_00013710 [Tetrahymena thermophila SB210]EAR88105.2 hypothetical protein TTHERM_00013710 [Tetrahymena thermophila SB210]|eukprot:XP_001008350.2 hypothetical protein TTHERM_00013710 [Tetrahymena thermophila SB210]
MMRKGIIFFALIAVLAQCHVKELNESNFLEANIVLNTIHDGYFSTFKGPIWNYQNRYLIFQSCQQETTASVQQQFIDKVVAKLPDNLYVIPFFVFESEANINENIQTRDVILTVKRKYGNGLAVSISLKTDESDEQKNWIESFEQLESIIDSTTHYFGDQAIKEVQQITSFLKNINICSQLKV